MEVEVLTKAILTGFLSVLRAGKPPAIDPLIMIVSILIGYTSLPMAKAAETMDVTSYSFTNSPLLIAPKACRANDRLHVVAQARFVNDCYADAGIDASYIDLGDSVSGIHRVLILQQRVDPEGCPDIFMPEVRPVMVVARAAEFVQNVYVLDHVARQEAGDLMPPPVPLPVSSSSGDCENEALVVRASPLAGFTGRVPSLASARILSVTEERMVWYAVELVASVPKGRPLGESLAGWRFETRIGVSESESVPVTDWLLILPKHGVRFDGERAPATFQIELVGAGDVDRRLGLLNPLAGRERERKPFAFFHVR